MASPRKTSASHDTTVDAYLKTLTPEAKRMIEQLRGIVSDAAPEAEEVFRYGMPMYRHHGPLVGFAAFKHHIGFYAHNGSFVAAHQAELEGYKTSKGTIQFPIGEALPVALIRRFIEERVRENEAKG